ncbi:MAG: hypothetical protein ACR2PA_09290 [Hyphomicrobiaceae bacterium]
MLRVCRSALVGLLLTVVFSFVHVSTVATANDSKPAARADGQIALSDFPGRWIGGGQLLFLDGSSARIRCTIRYVAQDRYNLTQRLSCDGKDMRVDIRTTIAERHGRITGSWNDHVYAASGQIDGHIAGRQIRAQLSSPFFNAAMSVRLDGNRQVIRLRPTSGELRIMQIRLARN